MNARTEIPPDVAAHVHFLADRTCCVCRERGKGLQLHHLDGVPTNHSLENLAALCLECHSKTQIRGGFCRTLDAHQVAEFRDDWYRRVATRRDRADELASSAAARAPEDPKSVPRAFPAASVHRAGPQLRGVALLAYIQAIPAVREAAYAAARPLWDSGSTANMMAGSYDVIDVFERVIAELALAYPERHFADSETRDFISATVSSRFEWHRAHLEPDGTGSRGTAIGPEAAAHVITDIEAMVLDMVHSLTADEAAFALDAWEMRWEEADSHS